MNNNFFDYLPGYFQGLSKVFTTYPFDVVKLHLQSNKYTTTYKCVKDLFKKQKNIFFRGIGIPIFIFPIERAISYKLYEDMKKKKYNVYIAGLYAGIVSSILNVPMQYLCTNIILKNNKNSVSFFKTIYYEPKKYNLYKGYCLDTSRSLLGSTLFLGTYGIIKDRLPNNERSTIIASICSISMTWIFTFPIDTIRVNYQISEYNSITNLINKQYNNLGIKSFYRGLTPVLIRSIHSTIFGMLIYEKMKDILNK